MTGDILLNLDSEDEGEIFMGCAGGKDTQATFHYEPVPTSDKMQYFRIDVKGLNGGHSGGEIHKGLGNANKILVRFLFLLKKKYDFVLCSIDGGNLRNAIAREAHAVIGLHPENKEDVRILLNHFAADVENELKHVDPSVQLAMESTDRPEYHIDNATAEKLILRLARLSARRNRYEPRYRRLGRDFYQPCFHKDERRQYDLDRYQPA